MVTALASPLERILLVMTKGIRIEWPGDEGRIVEIEYFCGIDIDCLNQVPELTLTPKNMCAKQVKLSVWVVKKPGTEDANWRLLFKELQKLIKSGDHLLVTRIYTRNWHKIEPIDEIVFD